MGREKEQEEKEKINFAETMLANFHSSLATHGRKENNIFSFRLNQVKAEILEKENRNTMQLKSKSLRP